MPRVRVRMTRNIVYNQTINITDEELTALEAVDGEDITPHIYPTAYSILEKELIRPQFTVEDEDYENFEIVPEGAEDEN